MILTFYKKKKTIEFYKKYIVFVENGIDLLWNSNGTFDTLLSIFFTSIYFYCASSTFYKNSYLYFSHSLLNKNKYFYSNFILWNKLLNSFIASSLKFSNQYTRLSFITTAEIIKLQKDNSSLFIIRFHKRKLYLIKNYNYKHELHSISPSKIRTHPRIIVYISLFFTYINKYFKLSTIMHTFLSL